MIHKLLAWNSLIVCSLVLAWTMCPSQARAQSAHPQQTPNLQQIQALHHLQPMRSQTLPIWLEQQLAQQTQQQYSAMKQAATHTAAQGHHAQTVQHDPAQCNHQQTSGTLAMHNVATHTSTQGNFGQAFQPNPALCNHSQQNFGTVNSLHTSHSQSTQAQYPIVQPNHDQTSALTWSHQLTPIQPSQDSNCQQCLRSHDPSALQSVSTATTSTQASWIQNRQSTPQSLVQQDPVARQSVATHHIKSTHEQYRDQQALLNRSQQDAIQTQLLSYQALQNRVTTPNLQTNLQPWKNPVTTPTQQPNLQPLQDPIARQTAPMQQVKSQQDLLNRHHCLLPKDNLSQAILSQPNQLTPLPQPTNIPQMFPIQLSPTVQQPYVPPTQPVYSPQTSDPQLYQPIQQSSTSNDQQSINSTQQKWFNQQTLLKHRSSTSTSQNQQATSTQSSSHCLQQHPSQNYQEMIRVRIDETTNGNPIYQTANNSAQNAFKLDTSKRISATSPALLQQEAQDWLQMQLLDIIQKNGNQPALPPQANPVRNAVNQLPSQSVANY